MSKKQKSIKKRKRKTTLRGKSTERWSIPSVNDLLGMLKAADIAAEASVVESFHAEISDILHTLSHFGPGTPPYEQRKRLNAVVADGGALLASLKKIPLFTLALAQDALAGRSGRAPTLGELRQRLPQSTELELRYFAEVGLTVPSDDSIAEMGSLIDGLHAIRHLAKSAKGAIRERKERRPDYARWSMVRLVALQFEHHFGREPSETKSGPWCSFLAALLTYCEEKEADNDCAAQLWRRAKKASTRALGSRDTCPRK